MQPDDQQGNYQQPNPEETGLNNNLEMYTPEPDIEASLVEETDTAEAPEADDEPVHWAASEYIHGEKNGLWFIIFAVVVIGLVAVDLIFWKSYTFSVLVVVMAAAVVIYSRRPPKNIEYTLSGDQGLYVGDKLYHFNDFKAFGLIRDGENHSIMLIPIKRFDPGVSVYFPEEVGEKVVDILGARLPMETLKLDIIDVIVRKLRL